jgi:hypothetical protein
MRHFSDIVLNRNMAGMLELGQLVG